uniref:Uncharacterized protein n=1 Tax=Anopheles farauti TaxID=69004 RepID=A0A182QXD0_9DIPT
AGGQAEKKEKWITVFPKRENCSISIPCSSPLGRTGHWQCQPGDELVHGTRCGGKDGQFVDPYRALERVAQASLGNRHAGPNGGRLFGRVTSADTCHGEGKFLRYQNTRLHLFGPPMEEWAFGTQSLPYGSDIVSNAVRWVVSCTTENHRDRSIALSRRLANGFHRNRIDQQVDDDGGVGGGDGGDGVVPRISSGLTRVGPLTAVLFGCVPPASCACARKKAPSYPVTSLEAFKVHRHRGSAWRGLAQER